MLAETDGLTGIAANAANRITDAAISSDSILLLALFCLPIVWAFVYGLLWKFGGGQQRDANKVKIAEAQRDAMVCVKDIAEIHERVIDKSPAAYQEVIRDRQRQTNPPDRSPRLKSAQ
jgi:hypothetical protein